MMILKNACNIAFAIIPFTCYEAVNLHNKLTDIQA